MDPEHDGSVHTSQQILETTENFTINVIVIIIIIIVF